MLSRPSWSLETYSCGAVRFVSVFKRRITAALRQLSRLARWRTGRSIWSGHVAGHRSRAEQSSSPGSLRSRRWSGGSRSARRRRSSAPSAASSAPRSPTPTSTSPTTGRRCAGSGSARRLPDRGRPGQAAADRARAAPARPGVLHSRPSRSPATASFTPAGAPASRRALLHVPGIFQAGPRLRANGAPARPALG